MTLLSQEDVSKFDVIVLTETWTTTQTNIKGFYAVECLAVKAGGRGRPSGGVAVLYSNQLGNVRIVSTSDNCVILAAESINIIAMYSSPAEEPRVFLEKVTTSIDSVNLTKPTLVCGDFNCPVDKPSTRKTKLLFRTMELRGLWMPTESLEHTFIGPRGRDGLSRELDLSRLLLLASPLLYNPQDISVEEFNSAIVDSIRQGILRKNPRREGSWFTPACRLARSYMMQAYILSRIQPYMTSNYTRMRRAYRRVIRDAKAAHSERVEAILLREAARHPYRWLRSEARVTACPVPSAALREHFRKMFTGANSIPDQTPLYPSVWSATTSLSRTILGQRFSVDEVAGAIMVSPLRKATGPDLIRNEHLRQALVLSLVITAMFNKILETAELPRSWSERLLRVIPKGKGDPLAPSSYRGIAKKNVIYKLLSGILARRLEVFLESESFLSPEQHGFRREMSTYTAASVLLNREDLVLLEDGVVDANQSGKRLGLPKETASASSSSRHW
ncbi:uncharacterized protein LOC108864395 [Galendromus occidentalis]|uniref:Uncharacterized protein LOC108864395 n=1 Tax=Galendromus occidentalis TaxID=34638 RepID=A0AAJ7L6E7_9ACAR|nr:uncharacterized protein LOC108864395 [Galendromus occidentalis]